MEKKYKICGCIPAKVIAMLLLILSAFWFVVSTAGIAICEVKGVYTTGQDEALKQQYSDILSKYSIGAVTDREHEYRYEELKKTNFRYGVIRTDDFEKVDIKDRSNYDFECFDQTFDEMSKDDLHIYSCTFNDNTCFSYNPSLFGYAGIYNESAYATKFQPIQGVYYDWQTERMYVSDGEKLYPYYGEIQINVPTDHSDLDGMTEEAEEETVFYGVAENLGAAYGVSGDTYVWTLNPKSLLQLIDFSYQLKLSDVEILDTVQLSKKGTIREGNPEISAGGFLVLEEETASGGTDDYYVISYVAEPLAVGSTLEDCDLFAQAKYLNSFLYENRYVVAVHFVLSLLVGILCMAFLLAGAGRKSGKDELVSNFWYRIPLDLSLAFTAAMDGLILFGVVFVLAEMVNNPFIDYRRVLPWLMVLIGGSLCVIVTQLWLMSLAYHVKAHQVWRHTICYKLFAWCMRILKKIWKWLGGIWSALRDFFGNLSVYQYSLFVIAALGAVEFVLILCACGAGGLAIFLWLLQLVALVVVAYKVTKQVQLIKDAGEKLAGGSFEQHLQTRDMLAPLRRHGENLNAIGDGMEHAVAERMKSERMKTELITNVSHDIKTPLTSIINYVDLLGKENIEGEQAKEYLEVLSRQSEKLKKLIEDLIEASKASTGNLAVDKTTLDASVVMTQVVGEFEEKLAKNRIELIVQTPEQPVNIVADSRHLWRVFDNLLGNICKYALPGTRAYVNLEQISDEKAVVIFRNISKEQLNLADEELLERFVRADASRHTEGNGLGLSIAKSLMELMGGRLDLTVDGDLFKVSLEFQVSQDAVNKTA